MAPTPGGVSASAHGPPGEPGATAPADLSLCEDKGVLVTCPCQGTFLVPRGWDCRQRQGRAGGSRRLRFPSVFSCAYAVDL